jgi:hypothetical protein
LAAAGACHRNGATGPRLDTAVEFTAHVITAPELAKPVSAGYASYRGTRKEADDIDIELAALAPLAGRWELRPDAAIYLGPQEHGAFAPFGLAISGHRLRSGRIRAAVVFQQEQQSAGRVVFGHNAATGAYFSAGIGGYHFAYLLDEYIPGTGWRALRTEGSENNLSRGTSYAVEVQLRGQRVRLLVNSVRVLEGSLPYPLSDDQIGLFAWGSEQVQFSTFTAETAKPEVFVVMHFGEPYDTLYRDVIAPIAVDMDFAPYRADDVYRPGLVLHDIIQGLVESEVIVAEITPPNPNVFYELGYAHALGKPTILLAERGRELPFDIRGYRCIFYDNTIAGKKAVETSLKKHLANIKGAWDTPAEAD